MLIRFLIGGSIILAIGIFMVLKGRKETNILKTYESENRSSDGEVHFDTSESSRVHGANKALYLVITVFGFFVGVFGVILLGYGFGVFHHP